MGKMTRIFSTLVPVIPCGCGCGIVIKSYADRPSHKRYYKEGHKQKFKPNKGENHYRWSGGRVINSNGYILVKKYDHPRSYNGYVFEHILVMEKHLGRYIDYKKEECHHINGNRQDNRIENLELLTKSEHARISRLKDSYETKKKRYRWT